MPGKEHLNLGLEKKRGLGIFLLCKKCLPFVILENALDIFRITFFALLFLFVYLNDDLN